MEVIRDAEVDLAPFRRSDGSFYEFAGFTAMEYAGSGHFCFQEDIYNRVETDKIIAEWKPATGGAYEWCPPHSFSVVQSFGSVRALGAGGDPERLASGGGGSGRVAT
jgi:hypothetical protein